MSVASGLRSGALGGVDVNVCCLACGAGVAITLGFAACCLTVFWCFGGVGFCSGLG